MSSVHHHKLFQSQLGRHGALVEPKLWDENFVRGLRAIIRLDHLCTTTRSNKLSIEQIFIQGINLRLFRGALSRIYSRMLKSFSSLVVNEAAALLVVLVCLNWFQEGEREVAKISF